MYLSHTVWHYRESHFQRTVTGAGVEVKLKSSSESLLTVHGKLQSRPYVQVDRVQVQRLALVRAAVSARHVRQHQQVAFSFQTLIQLLKRDEDDYNL